MFDFGFGELLLLAVIALVVLGPERLPVAARLAGLWIRKARAQWNSVKAELENELADEELRRSLRETADAVRNGAQQMRSLPASMLSNPAPPKQPPAAAADVASGDTSLTPPLPSPDGGGAPEPLREINPQQLSLLGPESELPDPAPSPDRPRTHG